MEQYRIDMRQPSTHFLYTTVQIECHYADGTSGSGTAFFFRDGHQTQEQIPYLVTNNHVIEDTVRLRIQFHLARNVEPWDFSVDEEKWVTIEDPLSLWTPHPDNNIDLCGVPVAILKDRFPELDGLYFDSLSSSSIPSAEEKKHFHALMSVAMIGYPNGLWDEQNNLPILRRGTTASHPAIDFDGRPEVMIDMACFPGSSGSPVVYHDLQYFASAVRFLGVLHAGPTLTLEGNVAMRSIPTRLNSSFEVKTMIHLGYVIKAEKVLELTQFIGARSRTEGSSLKVK